MLLKNGADPNVKGALSNTALITASQANRTQIVALLLKNGANVNDVTDKGATALTFASSDGHANVVAILLHAGADVEQKVTFNGYTSFLLASNNGNAKVVQLLMNHNANTSAVGNDGKTALDLATRHNHYEIIEMLEEQETKTLPSVSTLNNKNYKGNYKDSQRHGQGTFTYTNGAKYSGLWQHNQKHGHGVMVFNNGNRVHT